MTVAALPLTEPRTLIDELLAEQQALTAVERFARWHAAPGEIVEPAYRRLLPASSPRPGEQYAFEVNLDQCSGCKACVTACHSLNGLDETETWRSVGLLIGEPTRASDSSFQQHVTTACHHCADPGCLNGCPVLAYEKDPITGIVRHLDDQCIGCQYCVMKCPYEVPKYSDRLGIVRKCDLCHSRLAVGEAPACVQACPNEAIKIALVETGAVREKYRNVPVSSGVGKGEKRNGRNREIPSAPFLLFPSASVFLPDAPNPALTLPTTRFLSTKLSLNLRAADHSAPRRDQPHWPLVIMLVFTQAAAGLFLATGFVERSGPLRITGFGLLVAGLAASVLHLGQPLKAWRAFLGWRKSWLSREIIAFNGFAGTASFAILYPPSSILAVGLGLLAVATSAMVYADTGRALWSPRFVFGNFFGTTLLLGTALTAAVMSRAGDIAAIRPFVIAALLIGIALFTWRRLTLRTGLRNSQSPIHLNARVVGELFPWTIPAQNKLFIASVVFGLLAIFQVAAAPWWASLAALTTLGSEIIARHVFFIASADKRMPRGIVA